MCAGMVPGGPLGRRYCTPARTWATSTNSRPRPSSSGRASPTSPRPHCPRCTEQSQQHDRVGDQVGDPGQPGLAVQVLDPLPAPRGHRPAPDRHLDDAAGQHSDRSHQGDTAQPTPVGSASENEGNRITATTAQTTASRAADGADQGHPQVRRHPGRDRRLLGRPVRADLLGLIVGIAHDVDSFAEGGLAVPVRNRPMAARQHRSPSVAPMAHGRERSPARRAWPRARSRPFSSSPGGPRRPTAPRRSTRRPCLHLRHTRARRHRTCWRPERHAWSATPSWTAAPRPAPASWSSTPTTAGWASAPSWCTHAVAGGHRPAADLGRGELPRGPGAGRPDRAAGRAASC